MMKFWKKKRQTGTSAGFWHSLYRQALEEIVHDRICGRWIGQDDSLTRVTLIKSSQGYMCTVFRESTIIRQLHIYRNTDGTLDVDTCDGKTPAKVWYAQEGGSLIIDGIGTFVRDHLTQENTLPSTPLYRKELLQQGQEPTSERPVCFCTDGEGERLYRSMFFDSPGAYPIRRLHVSRRSYRRLEALMQRAGIPRTRINDYVENIIDRHLNFYENQHLWEEDMAEDNMKTKGDTV